MKAQIEQIIVQQRKADAYQKFLDDLRKKAKIEILVPELKTEAPGERDRGDHGQVARRVAGGPGGSADARDGARTPFDEFVRVIAVLRGPGRLSLGPRADARLDRART